MKLTDQELRRAIIKNDYLSDFVAKLPRAEIQALQGVMADDARQLRRYLQLSARPVKRIKKEVA